MPMIAISGLALLMAPAVALAETSVHEAKDLYQLNREEVDSGFPVRLRGTITYCRGPEFPEFVMQDKSAGFIAELPHGQETANRLEPGDEIEIEGITRLSEGLPTRVAVSRFWKTGMQALPAPISISPAAIARGGGRYSYIEFPGVIRDAQIDTTLQPPRLVLRFGEPQDPLFVRLTGFDETAVAMLVPDTRVLVRGVALGWSTPSLQPIASFVVVQEPAGIEQLSPALPAEARTPVPLAALISTRTDPFEVRRQRVKGNVTFLWPGKLMILQDGAAAIQIPGPAPPDIRPGDRLDVSGFPGSEKGKVTLHDIYVRREGIGDMPQPESVTARQVIGESLKAERDSKRIRITARFSGLKTTDQGHVVELKSEGVPFEAVLPLSAGIPADLENSREIAVTGACRIFYGPTATHEVSGAQRFGVFVQDGNDIEILSLVPWWSEKRFDRIALMVLSVFFAICLVSVFILHVKARAHKRRLEQESRAREASELLAAERARLAADLHDTLSQTLSGASLQLEASEAVAGSADAWENLTLAKVLLDRGREELRRAVWDLTPSALLGTSLEKALRAVSAEFAAYCDCEILISSDPELPVLNERARSHLFRIGQEAIYNAVRHGHAKNIRVEMRRNDSCFVIRIEDDGGGFDPAEVPGPMQGHFGLGSMRDRASRMNGSLVILSSPSRTVVTATVPLHSNTVSHCSAP